jgi:hypothetical protein
VRLDWIGAPNHTQTVQGSATVMAITVRVTDDETHRFHGEREHTLLTHQP